MSLTTAAWAIRPGLWFPLGATIRDGGTNFAVASGVADGMLLCLFDEHGAETRIPLPDRDGGIWHGFVPGVGAGQAYGYRAAGPYDPGRGARCNPAKLLLDPYAKAITGEVRFGPEVLGHASDDPDRPNPLDSADHMPRSLVVDAGYAWTTAPVPPRRYADSVIYEVHVKGFTAAHPGVPPELRRTYAGLGRRVQGHGRRPALRRTGGAARRGVQPHRRRRPHGPDPVPPRAGQRGLLPAAPRRSPPLRRHDRVRQLHRRR